MKLDRLLGILATLLQNDRVTVPRLAEKFEVSSRTVRRDIDALGRAGIPVATRQGAGGGVSIAEGYKLDKSVLTAEELQTLVAALRGLGSVSGQAQLQRTLDKLGVGDAALLSLRDSIVIDLGAPHQGSLSEKIALLRRAIRERCPAEFDYYSDKGRSRRRVEPYCLSFQWGAWYLFGWCAGRQDWRLFKLNRLWALSLGAEPFAPRELPAERGSLFSGFSDEHRLTALFDPAAEYQLVESYGPGSFTRQADGRLRLEIGYTNREFILTWLLGFGDRVRVLEPAGLAGEVRRIAENILKQYE